MANVYVEVPAEEIERKLCDKGFTADRSGREVVYTRVSVKNPGLTLKVYSSVAVGKLVARDKDTDAIRVILLGAKGSYKGKPREPSALYRAKILRVNSVQGVLDRLWERLGEAAVAADKFLKVCPVCGSIAYSDSGNCFVRACREEQLAAKRRAYDERQAAYPQNVMTVYPRDPRDRP